MSKITEFRELSFHGMMKQRLLMDPDLEARMKTLPLNFPDKLLHEYIPGGMYILNYKTLKYHYLSQSVESLIGYTAEEMYDRGSIFFMSLFHPEDYSKLTKGLANRFKEKVRSIKEKELHHHRFSMNFRIRRKDGVYVQMLFQYAIALRDLNQNPYIAVGTLCDISSIKKDDSMRLQVSRFHPKKRSFSESEVLFESTKPLPISLKQLDILRRIVQGKRNKEIAEELNLSIYTIRAHRRLMLRKTDTKNFTELIQKAVTHFWI